VFGISYTEDICGKKEVVEKQVRFSNKMLFFNAESTFCTKQKTGVQGKYIMPQLISIQQICDKVLRVINFLLQEVLKIRCKISFCY